LEEPVFETVRNLPVGRKLGVSFGIVVALMIVSGAIAFTKLESVSARSDALAARNAHGLELAGSLDTRIERVAHLVAQHLYVVDGDLAEQDRIEAEITKARGANMRDIETLGELLDTPPAADEAWALGETSRFGAYAQRLWAGPLRHEQVDDR
jgi:hypothetical protein